MGSSINDSSVNYPPRMVRIIRGLSYLGTCFTTAEISLQAASHVNVSESAQESYNCLDDGHGNGQGFGGTLVLGAITTSCATPSSSEEPDDVIHIRTHNALPYNVVEDRAKSIYDDLDNKHEHTIDGNATLVSESDDVRSLVSDIFGDRSKEQILEGLEVMKRAYQKTPNNERR